MIFSPKSFWNQKLPAVTEIDIHSIDYVSYLAGRIAAGTPWFNDRDFAPAVFYVEGGTPKVKVTLDRPPGTDPQLEQAFSAVPIPSYARPTGPWVNGDNHLVIVDYTDNTYWEMWGARNKEIDGPHPNSGQSAGATNLNDPGWHFLYGAAIQNLHTSPGYFDKNSWPSVAASKKWGAGGMGPFLAGGLIRPEEVLNGTIPHALCVSVDRVRTSLYRWPATRTDGITTDTDAPIAGMCFRLPASYDVTRFSDPFLRAVVKATRDYGFYICDSGGNAITFYAEVRSTIPNQQGYSTPHPWYGVDENPNRSDAILTNWPNNLLHTFPWNDLQVVHSSYRPAVF